MMNILRPAKGSGLPWLGMEFMRPSVCVLTQRYTVVSQLPTGGAFLGLPSFAPERGDHTKKRTRLPDADGQGGSPTGTDGKSSNGEKTIENPAEER